MIAQFSQVLVAHPHFGHCYGRGEFLYFVLFFLAYFINVNKRQLSACIRLPAHN